MAVEHANLVWNKFYHAVNDDVSGRSVVTFASTVSTYTLMAEDRRSGWESVALDAYRFKRRCQELEHCLNLYLSTTHRHYVYQTYFSNQ